MGTAHPMNVMETWQNRSEVLAEQHAKTVMSTLEVLELIDPTKKRQPTRAQRRAMRAEIDKTAAKLKGLQFKSKMIIEEIKRHANQS